MRALATAAITVTIGNSPIPLTAVHEAAARLAEIGLIDKRTMKEFDALCLTQVEPLSAEQIREIRQREGASQAVFARCLDVTTGLVSQWERAVRSGRGRRP